MDRRRPRNPPTRPLVLVVDDHGDTRELYVQSLVALVSRHSGPLIASRLTAELGIFIRTSSSRT
jgi:hypothetical protein